MRLLYRTSLTISSLQQNAALTNNSAPLGQRSIAISLSVCLSVCLCVCVCLSVREHISGTARPIFMKVFAQIPCGHGSMLLWWRFATLCTSGFLDDVTFGRNGPYGDAWKAEPLTYYHQQNQGGVWCLWMPCCNCFPLRFYQLSWFSWSSVVCVCLSVCLSGCQPGWHKS